MFIATGSHTNVAGVNFDRRVNNVNVATATDTEQAGRGIVSRSKKINHIISSNVDALNEEFNRIFAENSYTQSDLIDTFIDNESEQIFKKYILDYVGQNVLSEYAFDAMIETIGAKYASMTYGIIKAFKANKIADAKPYFARLKNELTQGLKQIAMQIKDSMQSLSTCLEIDKETDEITKSFVILTFKSKDKYTTFLKSPQSKIVLKKYNLDHQDRNCFKSDCDLTEALIMWEALTRVVLRHEKQMADAAKAHAANDEEAKEQGDTKQNGAAKQTNTSASTPTSVQANQAPANESHESYLPAIAHALAEGSKELMNEFIFLLSGSSSEVQNNNNKAAAIKLESNAAKVSPQQSKPAHITQGQTAAQNTAQGAAPAQTNQALQNKALSPEQERAIYNAQDLDLLSPIHDCLSQFVILDIERTEEQIGFELALTHVKAQEIMQKHEGSVSLITLVNQHFMDFVRQTINIFNGKIKIWRDSNMQGSQFMIKPSASQISTVPVSFSFDSELSNVQSIVKSHQEHEMAPQELSADDINDKIIDYPNFDYTAVVSVYQSVMDIYNEKHEVNDVLVMGFEEAKTRFNMNRSLYPQAKRYTKPNSFFMYYFSPKRSSTLNNAQAAYHIGVTGFKRYQALMTC